VAISRPATILLVIACSTAGLPAFASAQRTLPVGQARPSLHVELAKPFVAGHGPFAGARLSTTVWDASFVVPLGGGPTLFARGGLAYASIEGIDHSLAIAKPRVGAMIGREEGLRGEAHVDLPFAKELGNDYASGIALFTAHEEFERFETNSWSIGASASAEREMDVDAFFGARVGGTLRIPTGGDADVLGLASVFAHSRPGRARVRVEFSTLMLASRPGLDFSERTTFFASLEAGLPFARFGPEFFARAPIDESLDGTVPLVAGVRMHWGG
jgi:hypothetical protein